jgi:hypothetical protein
VKRQKVFDTARWKYSRHLMTEEDIHINGKRVAMTERIMEEVLINEVHRLEVHRTHPRNQDQLQLEHLTYRSTLTLMSWCPCL